MEEEEQREEEGEEWEGRGGGGQRRSLKSALKFGGCAARTIGRVRRELRYGVIVSVCVKMKQCSRSVIASRRSAPPPSF